MKLKRQAEEEKAGKKGVGKREKLAKGAKRQCSDSGADAKEEAPPKRTKASKAARAEKAKEANEDREAGDAKEAAEIAPAMAFDLDEAVTGPAVKGAASTVVDEKATGTPLDSFVMLPATKAILEKRGIALLFPIQAKTYAKVLEGKDLIGKAKTGQGKTLAFVLPIVHHLLTSGREATGPARNGRLPRVLVMAPTRELAKQVSTEFEVMAPTLGHVCIYGGAMYGPQEGALSRGVDVVVGTPGRVIDHIDRGNLKLSGLSHVVLDEADEMLDIGFQEDIEKVLEAASSQHQKPESIQKLLWSATVPEWVQAVASKYMRDHIVIDVVGKERQQTNADVTHLAVKCLVWKHRAATLRDVLAVYGGPGIKTIIFAETKQEANELALSSGFSGSSQVLHGSIEQKQREVTMAGFRDGQFDILVATDVAARGLDVPDIRLVIQCEPPKVETYVHRSGRTGRAGKKGTCITFFSWKNEYKLALIERKTGTKMARIGAPQPQDIIRASLRGVVKKLNTVHDDVVPYFMDAAKQLLATRDAERTLATALALISGHCEPPAARSLTSATEGYTTVLFTSQREIRSLSYVWINIKSAFDEKFGESVKGMQLSVDSYSAVFDIPTELATDLDKPPWSPLHGCSFSRATELPELVTREDGRAGGKGGKADGKDGKGGKGGKGGKSDKGGRSDKGEKGGKGKSGKGKGDRGGGGGYERESSRSRTPPRRRSADDAWSARPSARHIEAPWRKDAPWAQASSSAEARRPPSRSTSSYSALPPPPPKVTRSTVSMRKPREEDEVPRSSIRSKEQFNVWGRSSAR